MIIRGQKQRRTRNRVSWEKSSNIICGAGAVRRCGIGEIERQNVEE